MKSYISTSPIVYLILIVGFLTTTVNAQDKEAISDEITSHVLRPASVEATDELIDQLQVPEGFVIEKFAEGLENPRMLAVSNNGDVYVSRRKQGDVLLLKDTNDDGQAEVIDTVLSKKGAHGLAIHDDKLYLVTVNEVYAADRNEDGTLGETELIIDDLPDGGQHPNRTIAFGPDDMMYISIGSTCNACGETNEENATIIQLNPDGTERKIFAEGLRNTIGFDWHPESQQLFGMDHGIDWLGDNRGKEELNRIEEGIHYGWPVIYGNGKANLSENPDSLSYDEFAEMSQNPVLQDTAHSSPLGMVFYTSDMFPEEFKGDAFVTYRGSWNREPASGYKISRIHFENGEATKFENFITGFLTDDGKSHFARLAGIAVYTDGSLLVADDSNGNIYRISFEG